MLGELPAAGRPGIAPDLDTIAYFDESTPEYHPDRLAHAIDMIRRRVPPGASLIDIGCGTGNTLEALAAETGVRDLTGIDVSSRCLEKAHARTGCATLNGSILDRDFLGAVERRFDVAVLAAVLHHLIGPTRAASRHYAALAIENALALVRPGGILIIVEPVFYPAPAMDAVFYVKKAVTRVTRHRAPILGEWNNVGPPVVSYLTNEQLAAMAAGGGRRIVERRVEPQRLAWLPGLLLRRYETTIALDDA
jgi:SAM-dependent methyltransferase